MKKHLLLLFFIAYFYSNFCIAQIENFLIPKDLQELSNEEIIEKIEEIEKHLYDQSDYEEIQLYINTLHTRAKKYLLNSYLVKSYYHFAYTEDVRGEYIEAIKYLYKALEVDLNDDEYESVFSIYTLRGKVYEQCGDDVKAFNDFETSLKIAEKHNDDARRAIAIANYGKIRRKAGEYHQALEHYKRALKIAMESDSIKEIPRINMIMGVGGSFLKLKKPDSALYYINRGIKKSRDINDIEGISYFYNDYGMAYILKEEYTKAIEYFEKAERITKELTNEKRLIEIYYNIAKCHHELKDYEQSNDFLQKVITIINTENDKSPKGETYIPHEYKDVLKLLIKNHRKLGNTEQLENYREKLITINDEIEKKDEQIRDKLYGFLEGEDQEALKLATLKNKKNSLQNRLLNYALLFVLVLLIVVCILFYKNQQKKKARFRELNIKIASLKYEKRLNIKEQTQLKKEKETPQPKKEVVITDKKVTAILESLKKFEQQEHYLDTNCNLRFVAKKVKTNATYLSKIINTDKGVSFNEYITELRMQYTLKRLQNDPLFRAYSVKSIALEVGYKSADSFTKHFKNYTQLYPSYYIKSLNKNA